MRVRGNISPVALSVETYLPLEGYVEVRLRENIKEVTETDPRTGSTYTMFEYDEYILFLKSRDGLKSEIEDNLDAWLETAQTLEIRENASALVDLKQLNSKYEAALTEIEAALEVET